MRPLFVSQEHWPNYYHSAELTTVTTFTQAVHFKHVQGNNTGQTEVFLGMFANVWITCILNLEAMIFCCSERSLYCLNQYFTKFSPKVIKYLTFNVLPSQITAIKSENKNRNRHSTSTQSGICNIIWFWVWKPLDYRFLMLTVFFKKKISMIIIYLFYIYNLSIAALNIRFPLLTK